MNTMKNECFYNTAVEKSETNRRHNESIYVNGVQWQHQV